MSNSSPKPRIASSGFTFVELMVAVAMLAILMGLAMPSFALWIQNAKTRTATDSLQNGLRQAQAEAVRLHRQTVLFRSASGSCNNAAVANGTGGFWVLRSVPRMAGDSVETLQCGQLLETNDSVTIAGPTALCFNGIGRMTANDDPGLGGTTCTLPADGTAEYDFTNTVGDRALRVVVSISGNVRLCDRSRSLSASQPDGCP
jgi:type IV fimbrial biogenesis protein FimT